MRVIVCVEMGVVYGWAVEGGCLAETAELVAPGVVCAHLDAVSDGLLLGEVTVWAGQDAAEGNYVTEGVTRDWADCHAGLRQVIAELELWHGFICTGAYIHTHPIASLQVSIEVRRASRDASLRNIIRPLLRATRCDTLIRTERNASPVINFNLGPSLIRTVHGLNAGIVRSLSESGNRVGGTDEDAHL